MQEKNEIAIQEKRVLENQGLIRHCAKRIQLFNGINYDDLIGEGQIGLIKAAKTFQEEKKVKFATYAVRCITNQMLMYVRKNRKHAKVMSLENTVISQNSRGDELILKDTIEDQDAAKIEQKLENEETVEKVLDIVLNKLPKLPKLILLCSFSGETQRDISNKIGISQSYLSRIRKKYCSKIEQYLQEEIKIKHRRYEIKVKDHEFIIYFNKVRKEEIQEEFFKFVKEIKGTDKFYQYYNHKKMITIKIPAEEESFRLLAKIVQVIEE